MPFSVLRDPQEAPAESGASSRGTDDVLLEVVAVPHSSLSGPGFARVVSFMFAALCIPLMGVLATVAFWWILPFAMGALGLLWLALRRSWRDRDIEERPTLPVRDDTRAAPSPAPREAMTPTRRGGSAFAVSDMTGRTVYGANGEEIGSVERVMRLGRQTYVVVEHGGFLGLGDTDIPVPVGELRVRDGELVATNLTAERAEEMQANDIERGEDLADDDQVRVRRMR